MFDVLFVLLYVLVPITIIFVYKANGISLFRLNLITMIFWMYLTFSYIGTVILYFGLDEYRVILGIVDKSLIFEMYLYTTLALVLLMSCYLVGYKAFSSSGFIVPKVYKLTESNYQRLKIMFFICLSVMFVYLIQLPKIPIFEALSGATNSDIALSRSQATNDFSGKIYYYRVFFGTGLLVVNYALFSAVLLKSKIRNLKIMFSISTLFTIFSTIYSGQKSPIVWYLIGLFFVYIITTQKKVSFKFILKAVSVILIVITLVYKIFMNIEGNIFQTIGAVFSRTFTGQLSAGYYYVEIFPEVWGFLQGKSFPNPGGIFPWNYFNLPVEIMHFKFQYLSHRGVVGSAPTGYWAESYANFGVLGIVLSSIYLATLILIIQIIFDQSAKNPVTIAIYVWLALEFKNLALTGVGRYLFNIDILFVIAVLFLFKLSLKSSNLLERREG